MNRLPLVLPALGFLLAVQGPALAQRPAAQAPGGGQATLVATYNDWSTYTAQTGRAKICYALSQPKSRTPANLKDTPAYVFVSFRPAENVRNEVATVLGFNAKDGGDASVTIGNASFPLVTKAQNAWVKNPAEEAQVIAAMSRGQTMTLSVTSARGNKTGDRYSLAGFAQALDRAKKECP
ncbi:invasion associated locus B family protein [Enterovirga sp. CN4-39]|uniref:invasion associated locus B family protein n=1 Tax=Enterovirga sp. CN4-39 TaxID=3400910 RepID=UPI003C071A99